MVERTNEYLKDFSESRYLELNPDVSDAVKGVRFSSGWDHYLRYGIYEERAGKPARVPSKMRRLKKSNHLPVPPPNLRKRVHGTDDLESFDTMGRAIAINLGLAIKAASIKFGPPEFLPRFLQGLLPRRRCSILDFGCGCGRALAWFKRLYEFENFYGADIDCEAISWCQKEVPQVGTFICNDPNPPLPLPDECFDFIYAISVFTHLPEDMQFAWLEELNRVAKRGSYLILTVHGKDLFPKKDAPKRRQFEEDGFFYAVGDGTEGLPDFYQTAFHTQDYIRSRWNKYFEIKNIINRGLMDYQDLVICMKR